MQVIQILGLITTLFAIIGSLYAFYLKIINPRLKRTKLLILSAMIEEWFDIIDKFLEKDLNMAELNNLENKIRDFISENLSSYQIKPNKRIIKKWNKKMGIKKELRNSSNIFQRYSRIPVNGIYLDMFITMLIANFYKFHSVYNSENKKECNFADVEMPVKFLRFYVRNL